MTSLSTLRISGRFLLFLSALLTVFLFGFTPSARAEKRVVTVGIYENAPKVFTSESGEPSGIFIDIIKEIAKIEGWNLHFSPGAWTDGLTRLEKGEIDLMPDVAYTVAREKIYSFHKVPVLSSWSQVYAPKGSNIQSILDLNGKRVAVLEKSIQQETFDRLTNSFGINIDIYTVPDYKTMFEAVVNNKADAAITNRFYGLMHAKKLGLADTAIIFDPSDLFYAAPKNASRQLLNAIDYHVASFKNNQDSVYYKSLKRWTSEEVRFKLPKWMQVAGLAALVALLTSLAAGFVLKHQVNTRTRELTLVNREMEERIKKRTAELADAMEKAQAADRIKSAFLATMSHELRTPLNSIIGFTGIMLQGLAGPLNPEQQKQMSMVQNSSRHLLALINDVLDISKIEAGQLDLSISDFDLPTSIEKVAKIVSPLAEKKGLKLSLDIAPDVGLVSTDQRRLEQIILNLANNAIKFTDSGRVSISCKSEGNGYLLSVSDTGIGIKPHEIPDLFQPFHQLDSGLTRKHEGTGLGLSICKRIMDITGGTIDVKSKPGIGSVFSVKFPKQAGGAK